MKKILSTISILTLSFQLNAQSDKFSWASTMGSSGNEQANAVITDPLGNVYTVGKFTGTVDFDPGPGVFNLTSFGASDAYLLKQHPDGSFLWAKKFGGGGDDESISIALDPLQNIYITGNFTGAADFDLGSGAGTLNSTGPTDIFFVKLNFDGMFQWVKKIGSMSPDGAKSIYWDKMGFLYATGKDWLNDELAEAYLYKMDPDGNGLWYRRYGSNGMDIGNCISTDKFGNIYTLGTFSGVGDFDPSAGVSKLGTNGMKDIFISKYSSSGNFLWVKQIGGSNDDEGNSIYVNDSNQIYITGSFSGKVDFNTSPLDADTNFRQSKGLHDMFIARLDLSGNLIWVKTVGNTNALCTGFSVKSDLSGYVYVAGIFTDTVNFDSRFLKISAGESDIFISKYDLGGNLYWTKQFGGIFGDSCMALEVDFAGNIITTGLFRDSVDFNPAKEENIRGSNGNSDIFVNKLDFCVPTYTTIKDTFCRPFTLDGVTYNQSGNYVQTITSLTGCEEFVTLNLDIRLLNDTISKSGVVLTSHANGLKYQWIECTSKKEIPGATGKSYIALGNNKYAVTLFDGSCRDTSDCIEINSFTASMEEFALQNSVKIFPNPSNGEFVIAVDENMLGSKAGIYNLLGQKVREVELNEINTKQSLTPGFYILEILKDQKHFTKKLLVD